MLSTHKGSSTIALIAGLAMAATAFGQWKPKDTEWPLYTADLAGSKYRPLDQINASNFNKLEVAWKFKTDNLGTRPEFKLEGTPLMVGGVIYATAGTRRAVVALDAKSGEIIWVHSLREGARAAISPRQLSGRGVSYWSDGREERILYVTTGYKLTCLNAKTGMMIPSFGENGQIDLKKGMYTGAGTPIDLETGEAGLHSTPTVVNDTVIVGSAFKEGMTVVTRNNTKGLVRAFDVKTGKLVWTFHTIPKKGEFGYETWENGSADYNGNTGVWTQITVDPQLGLVYLPVESPTSDYYGGERPGNNLFGESLVCVELKTGKMKWYYQIVHHPVWDYDLSSAPLLADVTVDGKPRKVVALPSKEAFLYVFDRETGKPIWPIEERPVAQTDVPGEKTSPTQPFPTKPPAYGRNFIKVPDDLIDFTPEMRAEALDKLKRYRIEGMFTPAVIGDPNGKWLGPINLGPLPMGNGLTRLATRFHGDDEALSAVLDAEGKPLLAADAERLGLVTFVPDDIDWDEEVRIAVEERASFSPDALTGLEANYRFVGPETLETKIFGRLSAWQNWIFTRPNASGPDGALRAYGTGKRADFDRKRV